MIRVFVLTLLTSPICSKPGYRSSVMYGERPILRLGPDESENEGAPKSKLTEPLWVTNLRTNIQQQIKESGLENAKPVIKNLIDKATVDNGYNGNGPEVQIQVKSPLRSGTVDWENDLKDYVKELVGTVDNKQLEDYVKPVISSIEKAHHVVINDIDVNPYGEVSVNYVQSGRESNSNFPNARFFQREGNRPEFEGRYTRSLE